MSLSQRIRNDSPCITLFSKKIKCNLREKGCIRSRGLKLMNRARSLESDPFDASGTVMIRSNFRRRRKEEGVLKFEGGGGGECMGRKVMKEKCTVLIRFTGVGNREGAGVDKLPSIHPPTVASSASLFLR